MNPKDINNLDPKLKETYERVMGTSLTEAPTVSPAMETQPVEQTPSLNVPTEPEAPMSSPIGDSTILQVLHADNTNESSETTTVNSPSESEMAVKGGRKKLLPIIIMIAIVFFVAYAILWAKLLSLF